MRTLLLIALLAATTLAHGATLYKTITPDGKVVYTDQPPQTGKIEKTFDFASLPSTPLPDSVTAYKQDLEKSMQSRLAGSPGSKQPVLFWAKWCGYCRQAEAYLTEKRISFQKLDVDTVDGKRALAQSGGGKGIPVLLANGEKVQGFSRSAYDQLVARTR